MTFVLGVNVGYDGVEDETVLFYELLAELLDGSVVLDLFV